MVKAKTKFNSTYKTWLTIGGLAIIFTFIFAIVYPMAMEKEGFVGEAVKVGKLGGDKSIDKSGSGTFDKSSEKGIDSTKKVMIEVCDDGIDNNANGLTDCQEDACISYQACSPNCYKYTQFGKLDLSKFIQSTIGDEFPGQIKVGDVKSFKYIFINKNYNLLGQSACLKRIDVKINPLLDSALEIKLYGENFNCLEIYKGMPLISFKSYENKLFYSDLGYDKLHHKIILTRGYEFKLICPEIVAALSEEGDSYLTDYGGGFDNLKTLKKCLDEGIKKNLIKTANKDDGYTAHALDITISCPEEICSNQKDDNANRKVDCEDSECSSYCGTPEICYNNKDDNGNLLIDCADYTSCEGKLCEKGVLGCECVKGTISGVTVGYATEILCSDQKDNDKDGKFNCDDSDCAADYNCVKEEVCTNGLDDDNDNQIDCIDKSDCLGYSCGDGCLCVKITGFGNEIGSAKETKCIDQKDNDKDGKVDCNDSDCTDDSACFVCTDTDGGKNYTTKGTVTDKFHIPKQVEDVCNDYKTINEYYCNGNKYSFITYDCVTLFGGSAKCVDGACVYTKCKDSDYTYYPYNEGFENTFNSNSLLKVAKVVGLFYSGTVADNIDYCPKENGTEVFEGYCLNDYIAKTESFNCPSGTVCQKGACVMS